MTQLELFPSYPRRTMRTLNENCRRPIHEGVKQILWQMQNGRCAYCRRSIRLGYHVDHIIPRALGGTDHRRNLQLTCPDCNAKKGSRDPLAFAKRMGLLV